ncbi:MAG TPA: ANTAR domain-containing protein, partial [Phycicoccus sp.]|nr:ANTAR domain-containing protein [Phycicoccus sp.]
LLAGAPSEQEAGRGPWAERAEVHHATGMVVAQLLVAEDDALALIRAHAYSHDQSVARSAHEILAGRLVFSFSPCHQIDST